MGTEKRFNGKALYQPSGKAAEYSPWAANFYTGCSNDCDYCYCKRGVMAHVWDTKPHLKKCFPSPEFALRMFCDEMFKNLEAVRKSGILFSFTTDPMLDETCELTLWAAKVANDHRVPVKILTKRGASDRAFEMLEKRQFRDPSLIAFGFTLTGHDEQEAKAASNTERIRAMRMLFQEGYKTFASIEPIIDPADSLQMIKATRGICDLYKVGTMSGRKIDYNWDDMKELFAYLTYMTRDGENVYLKDSFLNYFGTKRSECPGEFVGADYNLFYPAEE